MVYVRFDLNKIVSERMNVNERNIMLICSCMNYQKSLRYSICV